jgi:hypothetical protein
MCLLRTKTTHGRTLMSFFKAVLLDVRLKLAKGDTEGWFALLRVFVLMDRARKNKHFDLRLSKQIFVQEVTPASPSALLLRFP